METAEIIKNDLIKEILENEPDENDNIWFLKLSKQSQIDFILNREINGEINFKYLKIKTLIETNKILKTMKDSVKLEVEQKLQNKELAELAKIMDDSAEFIHEFIKKETPFKRYEDFSISAIEGSDYEVKITVTKKNYTPEINNQN